jgi:hypothetical protein
VHWRVLLVVTWQLEASDFALLLLLLLLLQAPSAETAMCLSLQCGSSSL